MLTTPKAVGVVTGVSSALAIQVAQVAQNTSVVTEWTVIAAFGAGAIGWGIAWGTMRGKLSAQEVTRREQAAREETARKELKADADRVASRLEADNSKVAANVAEVAKKVDDHTDKLRSEMRESAGKTQDTMNIILRDIGALSATMTATVKDTRLMITEHVLNCPAVPKPRKR